MLFFKKEFHLSVSATKAAGKYANKRHTSRAFCLSMQITCDSLNERVCRDALEQIPASSESVISPANALTVR